MIICTTISSLQTTLQQLKKQGKEIGFVPTMGALHNSIYH
jgi:pantothenate synthetase